MDIKSIKKIELEADCLCDSIQINKALEKYPQAKSNVQVIFVSVDPERDTPKDLTSYISFFNKDFLRAIVNFL